MTTKITKKKLKTGSFIGIKRTFMVQIVPLVLMLVVGSWLTLMAGQAIDQQRGEVVSSQAFEKTLVSRF